MIQYRLITEKCLGLDDARIVLELLKDRGIDAAFGDNMFKCEVKDPRIHSTCGQ
jgi:hypothetical protein